MSAPSEADVGKLDNPVWRRKLSGNVQCYMGNPNLNKI